MDITDRGICWSTTASPTIVNDKVSLGTGTGRFNGQISGLTQGTLYYARAYATNSVGTAYGNQISFTTIEIPLPTLTTEAITDISYITAITGGDVTDDNGYTVTARGVCFGTEPNPTIDNTVQSGGAGVGSFVSLLSNLTPNTLYYLRAFATNEGGTAYGQQASFTTLELTLPTITTKAITGISAYSGNSGGNIIDGGGTNITARGLCWNTTGTPTVDDSKTSDGTGTGSYNSMITGLNLNTAYYVRAYAINTNGTVYGEEISFPTPETVPPVDGLPVVGTKTVSLGNNVFNAGGYISRDGGSEITQHGVCWNTVENPTIKNDLTSEGAGIGYFESVIESLPGCGDTYYIKAYASNSTGTGYGNQVTTVSGLPPVAESTAEATEVTLTSAVTGGSITSNGGCEITQRGVCYGLLPNPTVNNFKVTSGTGVGAFTATLTNLYPNQTYYARSYGVNSAGTVYGPEIVFTTQAGASGLAIGQTYAGGIIFHLDETGETGLVCAPEDLRSTQWGCFYSIPGTQASVGTGASNTATILANCAEEGIPARLCDELVVGNYNDWFLPSKDELNLMYTNLQILGLGGFTSKYYWSSSKTSSYAWRQRFLGGYQYDGSYGSLPTEMVRAVRAF